MKMDEKVGWVDVTLKDIAKWGSGGTPKSTNPAYYDGNIPWLIIGDLNDGYVWESEKKITEDGLKNSSAKMVTPDSVLIAMYGSIGKLGINKIPLATNQAIAFTETLYSSTYNKYLFYYLLFSRPKLYEMGKGGTQRNISQTVLKKVQFPLPPLPEQRAIVSKIEQLFSELDNGIANLKLAQEQLKVYRQAVLKKAFEGELTKEWREHQVDLPSAAEMLFEIQNDREASYNAELDKWKESIKKWEEEGKKGKKPTKPKKPTETKALTGEEVVKLPAIPKSWKWLKTSEIIDSINNGYTPKDNFLSSGSGEIPFIKVYNLNFDGSFNFKKDPTFIPKIVHIKELARSITYPEDVLINIVGPPLGKVSVVTNQYPEWNINQAIVLFRPNQFITSKIISYYLQNPKTIHWLKNTSKATAGQFNVKVSTCREIPFPLCSIEEQRVIVQEIETRLSVCEKLGHDIEENLEKTEALRQSILKKAFEGKLLNERELGEVRNAPDWEPAEVLLEKINHNKKTKN